MAQRFAEVDSDGFVVAFYTAGVTPMEKIPKGAIPISDADHSMLLDGRGMGKRMCVRSDGTAELLDRPAPSPEVMCVIERRTRDKALAACDWLVVRALETGNPVSDVWKKYRQALRDVPAQKGFPQSIDWPKAPEQ